MDNICRLCCSTKFVNNYIFDEENALFLKMSLYLPIKVLKEDRLPQKVCDKCSCKVNDLYQFCNETIEVQNRLKSFLSTAQFLVNNTVDLTVIKPNCKSPPPQRTCNQSTQTEDHFSNVLKVKDEPNIPLPVTLPIIIKKEREYYEDNDVFQGDLASDNSEEELLIDIKNKKKNENRSSTNVVKATRGRKPKKKTDKTMFDIFENNGLSVIHEENMDLNLVKQEMELKPPDLDVGSMENADGDLFICCMCFTQCESRSALLTHYRAHGRKGKAAAKEKPTPPPPPPGDAPRCPRCQKSLSAAEWGKHWRRHYARDTRPFRCALCQATYRDHYKMLKHGLTHKADELRSGSPRPSARSFLCDICPETFVYMRCMLAHRSLAHPAAAGAPALRCGLCARAFAHPNSLRRHARSHSGARDHLCSVCGKALSSREHLKFHLRIHSGYKPNVCKTCGKGFVKKCNLKLHERVHSGEKPHVCSHCGKAFSQRSTLVIHERYHNGARPYVCSLCGRGFVARGLLTMHLKTACVDVPPRHRPAAPHPAPAAPHPAPPAPPAPAAPRLNTR